MSASPMSPFSLKKKMWLRKICPVTTLMLLKIACRSWQKFFTWDIPYFGKWKVFQSFNKYIFELLLQKLIFICTEGLTNYLRSGLTTTSEVSGVTN
jgi:hypothetical protein